MTLKVIGAGLGRTGTNSLKVALERLLDGPCYHMLELFERPNDVGQWLRAVRNEGPDWASVFEGYAAAVDWPAGSFYEPLMDVYPAAVVLLSTREDPEAWWRSFSSTILQAIDRVSDAPAPLESMVLELLDKRFTSGWRERDQAIAAYERHNKEVRERVPRQRLVEWKPGDGWGPLCDALEIAEPAEPFPHVNSTAEFRAFTGLDQAG